MADFIISTTQTERGRMTSFRVGDRTAYLLTPAVLTEHRIIGEAMKALSDGVASSGEILGARASDLTATGFAKLATETITARVAPPFNAVRTAITNATTDVEKRLESFRAPFFANDEPPAVRVELRQYARTLSLPSLMEAAKIDGSLTAAVIEGGFAMSGLPADIFDRLKRDVAVANATRILLGQHTYRTVPNANDPIGGKPDHDAARAAGEELIAALEAEEKLLLEAPATLAVAIDAVAIVTDTTRDAAFALLVA